MHYEPSEGKFEPEYRIAALAAALKRHSMSYLITHLSCSVTIGALKKMAAPDDIISSLFVVTSRTLLTLKGGLLKSEPMYWEPRG
jgi:hypothetical protein